MKMGKFHFFDSMREVLTFLVKSDIKINTKMKRHGVALSNLTWYLFDDMFELYPKTGALNIRKDTYQATGTGLSILSEKLNKYKKFKVVEMFSDKDKFIGWCVYFKIEKSPTVFLDF